MRVQTPFFASARLLSSFVNVQMLVVLFWLLCVLFVNISSHLLGFVLFWFFLKLLFATLTRSIDASTDCLHVFVLFFYLLTILQLHFPYKKNKEITLELYFFFVLLCFPSVFFMTVAQFLLLCFECCFCFYLLLPRRILVLPLTTLWMLLDFFCLFLIKDTVNYFLTFLYSCSWIVLLCEFVNVCVL